MITKTPEEINEQELMEYYSYKGKIGNIKLKYRLIRSWFLQTLAGFSPSSELAVIFQRARGVKIGKHVFLGPNVVLDLLYPHLIQIDDYVSIGMNSMIFTHSNPTCSLFLKLNYFPRKVSHVRIGEGAWIAPGTIILCGVNIGKNSVVGAGSLVIKNLESYSINVGSPTKKIKNLNNI